MHSPDIRRCDLRFAARNMARTLWAGLALWGAISLALAAVSNVVLLMRPVAGSWCAGPGYVQARFAGYKLRPLWPVPGSESGTVRIGGRAFDAPFVFVDDPTPGSAKPTGHQGFGIWRWDWPVPPDAVRMTMRHTDGRSIQLSSYGFFNLPETLPACEVSNANR